MGIFLKIEIRSFWRELLLIMGGIFRGHHVGKGIHMEGSGKDLATFQKNSWLFGPFPVNPWRVCLAIC